jgi:arylsulfatase A-like enzyme
MLQVSIFKNKGLIKVYALCLTSLFFIGCTSKEKLPSSPEIKKRPNIVVIITDQERAAVHWPKGWVEKNLPAMERLKKHGLTFQRAYTSAAECTPSRAVMLTSEHFPLNKTSRTPSLHGLPSNKSLMDIGTLLSEQGGYDVVWKGKWHLTPPLEGDHNWSKKDSVNVEKKYNISLWNPPDAGTSITEHNVNPDGTTFNGLTTLGAGYANNDSRYLRGTSLDQPKQTPGFGESVLDYLKQVKESSPEKRKPFCLFISFVNPHDVWVYPQHWQEAGYTREEVTNIGIHLPQNYADDLKTKPSVQLKARNAFNEHSAFKNIAEDNEYVNFYAYLHKVVDKHIMDVLDALDEAGLTEETIIIRTSDHGELGLSHGMREKAYTAYEEMIHIPLVISNPKLFPSPQTTDAFYCHLDLLPTLAELATLPLFKKYGSGVSVVPVIYNPTTSVQDSILFTFDDVFFLPEDVPGGHIRALREDDWTYALYYSEDGSHFEYEMYNLKNDPSQLHNLLYKDVKPENAKEAKRLHKKLKEKIDQAKALPKHFPWPEAPF